MINVCEVVIIDPTVVVEAEIVTDGRARAIMTVSDLVAMGVLRKAPTGRARTSTMLLEL